jgi:cytosine deaminase
MDRVLARARLPDGRLADIPIVNGRIAASGKGLPVEDLAGRMVWPGFVDLHTHLDKGHIWPRTPNADGTFVSAIEANGSDRLAHWTAEDVRARFDFGLRCAFAHGTVAIRTHIDSAPEQFKTSWSVFAALRAEWAGRITLQGVAIIGLSALDDVEYAERLAQCLVENGGIMGGVIYPMPDLEARIEGLLRLCMRHRLGLDVHVDETLDPDARTLPVLAEAALRLGFPTPIVVGHCCSLGVQDAAELDRTVRLMVQAGMRVVSLPMCNLYLQDRTAGHTPRRRGVTMLHELRAAGLPVSIASDNCRDPFYPYGDHDMLEVLREAVRIGHLDHPFDGWPDAVTATPAAAMGIDAGRIAPGMVADLVVFRARTMNELLSRPQADRVVLRAGVAVDTTLPDYAELDAVLGFSALAQ